MGKELSDKQKEEVLKIYEIFTKYANDLTIVRQQIHRFFISVFTISVSFVAVLGIKDLLTDKPITVLLLSLFLITICAVWFLTINSYQQLNKHKFEAIKEI